MNGAQQEYFELKRSIEQSSDFPKTFSELIDTAADRYQDKLALNFFQQGDGRRVSFVELRNQVYQLADGLQQQGVNKGTHVAVMLSNRVEFPITWLALATLGAVMVPVNVQSTSTELDYLLNDADSEYLIIEEDLMPSLVAMKQRSACLTPERVILVTDEGSNDASNVCWLNVLQQGRAEFRPADIGCGDDLLNIQYTSGTTGFPKGCMQTQRYWLLLGGVVAKMSPGVKSILSDAPFFYMDPQWMLVMGLFNGAAVHFSARMSASRFLDWVRTYQIEMAYFPNPLLGTPAQDSDADNPLKQVLGYAMSAQVTRLVERRFDVTARDAYGMTEIGPGLAVPLNIDDDAALDTCGLPTPFREVKVVDELGVEVAPGVAGELWVRGDGVISGYYNKAEANANSFVGDWFRTGDIFIRSEQGYYSIVGRVKDMIRRSSENISALEVEMALYGLPGVEAVAVIPVADDYRGEEVKACVLLAGGYTADKLPPAEVIAHCRKHLASFKVPRYLQYVETLPFTPSGKVAKHKLTQKKPISLEGCWDENKQSWL
jgi:carnitine-CoA ligase